jgi:hypothetical protein
MFSQPIGCGAIQIENQGAISIASAANRLLALEPELTRKVGGCKKNGERDFEQSLSVERV